MMEKDFREVDSRPPTYASPKARKKLDRQTPVSKQRGLTSRLERAHTISIGSNTEGEETEDCVYVKRNSRDAGHIIEEKRKKYISNRRKTMHGGSLSSSQCHCRSHTGALRKCHCNLSRQTSNPSVSESELMEHETKLIVLEFLQNLKPEELTTRLKKSDSLDFNSLELTGDHRDSHSPDVLAEINQFKQYKEDSSENFIPDEIQKPIENVISGKGCQKAKSSVMTKSEIMAVSEGTLPSPPLPQSTGNVKDVAVSTSSLQPSPPQWSSKEVTAFPNSSLLPPPPPVAAASMEATYEEKREAVKDAMRLPEEQIKKTDTENKSERLNSVKYNTVTIGEYEHNQLLEMIRKHNGMNANEMIGGGKIGRSHSSITEEQYMAARNKIRDMQRPVEKWLGAHSTIQRRNLVSEVASFDRTRLRKKMNSHTQKKKRPGLSLKIPKATVPPADISLEADPEIYTPETLAVNQLELIAQEIMYSYPDQLINVTKEMLKIVSNQDVNYDVFSKVASSIYNLRADKLKVTIWSRVAIVLYAVRETFYLGNLNDKQMELLVEYSTKFFSENAAKSVKEKGGWENLGEDIFPANGMTYDFEDGECLTHGPGCQSLQNKTDELNSDRNGNESNNNEEESSDVSEWTPYGVAAISVGLGLLYSYSKQ